MRFETSTMVPQQIAERPLANMSSRVNLKNKIRNTGFAVVASLPLVFSGAHDASATAGHSPTTTKDQGPKCVEVFGYIEDISGATDTLMQPSVVSQLHDNAQRALQDEPTATIFIDCGIATNADSAATTCYTSVS